MRSRDREASIYGVVDPLSFPQLHGCTMRVFVSLLRRLERPQEGCFYFKSESTRDLQLNKNVLVKIIESF